MTIEQRDCPICGGPIMFSYVRPALDFYFSENGKIERDNNKDLWEGTAHLEFYCSNDRTHELNDPPPISEYRHAHQKWEEKVIKHFYEFIFPEL